MRQRKGVTEGQIREQLTHPNILGPMMVYMGDADCYLAGVTASYPEVLRPALQIFHTQDGTHLAASVYLILIKGRTYVFSDATVNIDPSAEDLAQIAILAHEVCFRLHQRAQNNYRGIVLNP